MVLWAKNRCHPGRCRLGIESHANANFLSTPGRRLGRHGCAPARHLPLPDDENRCPHQFQRYHSQKRRRWRADPDDGSEATETAEKDRSPERTEQYRLSLNRWEYRIHRDAKAQPETAVESQVAVEADGNAAAQVKRIAQPKQANAPCREGNHTEDPCNDL